MNKKLIAIVLATVVIFGAAGVGTMAWFTSQSTSNNNNFTTGTLVLGGIIDNQNTQGTFESVVFNNMEPGEPPIKVASTILRNAGSLPLYINRINASSFNGDVILDEVLNIKITIDDDGKDEAQQDVVFQGKLSEMSAAEGGYFDRIFMMETGTQKVMTVYAYMDQSAGNDYQNLDMSCDFTVFASQNNTPINPVDNQFVTLGYLKNPPNEIVAKARDAGNGWLIFDFDRPSAGNFEENLIVEFKHERGTPDAEADARISHVPHNLEALELSGILEGKVLNTDVKVGAWPGEIHIRKAIFTDLGWREMQVKFTYKRGSATHSLDWVPWTLTGN